MRVSRESAGGDSSSVIVPDLLQFTIVFGIVISGLLIGQNRADDGLDCLQLRFGLGQHDADGLRLGVGQVGEVAGQLEELVTGGGVGGRV